MSAPGAQGAVRPSPTARQRPGERTRIVQLQRTVRRQQRQAAAIASLGREALVQKDLGELIQHGLQAVRDALEMPLVALFQPVRGGEVLAMRAGIGWREGVVGQLLLNVPACAHVNYALERGEAVVTSNGKEPVGFHGLPLFRDHGIVHGMSVVMPGPEAPTGVLGAYAVEPRAVEPGDIEFLHSVANILAAAHERKDAEEGLVQTQIRLQSVQKMEAIGRLAGGIAHDFNNLVQAITGYTEILLKCLPEDEPLHRNAVQIQRAGNRAAELTRKLLAFSRQQVLQTKVLDVNRVVMDVEQLLRRLIGEDVELETILARDLGPVRADATQLEQVLMNLAVNSRDAMPDGGTLTIQTRNVELTEADQRESFAIQTGDYVLLSVSDTGRGMDSETKARAFEPFFTTKPAGEGTGLGLSTVYGIVKQSGGYIWVDSEPDLGTRVRIYLPRVEGEVESIEPARPVVSSTPRGCETLLLVEDEEGVRDLVKEWMSAQGYTVLTAENGLEALALAEAHRGSIDLLIADVVMPQMGGPALADRLLPSRPEMKVIYVSGYAEEAIGDPDVLHAADAFLEKPFTLESLVRKVREILDQRS